MALTTVLQSPMRVCALGPLDIGRTSMLFRPVKSTIYSRQLAATTEDIDINDASGSISLSHLKLDDEQIAQSAPSRPTIHQIPLHPCLGRFQIYERAVQVYKAARGNRRLQHTIEKWLYTDRQLKQRIYQLVFEALHCREVIIEMLVESGFYSKNFDLYSHEDLVLVMAYEFQGEKFSLRLPGENAQGLPPEVVKVAEALWSHKVKLGATLARMRVKQNASKVFQLIPEPLVRLRFQSAEHFYCSARVSSHKVNNSIRDEVLSKLKSEGITLVHTCKELHSSSMYQPTEDLLVFSADFRPNLLANSLVEDGSLVLQGFSSYFCVDQSMQTIIKSGGGDVVFTECFSGIEVLHAASILGSKGTVRAFNVSPDTVDTITANLVLLGLQNVQLICATFLSSSPSDEILSNVKLVVCMPSSPLYCPLSTHPVDYVLQEGDSQLPWLGPKLGINSSSTSMQTDNEIISHALQFKQAEHVVLVSCDDAVNIKSALEAQSKTFSLAYGGSIPVGASKEGLFKSSYTITVINKKSPMPRPRTVLAKAIASGLLDSDCLDNVAIAPKKQVAKKRKTKTRQARINALHQGIPLASPQKRIDKKKR